jgi:TP901 family phage tail tape measure protein
MPGGKIDILVNPDFSTFNRDLDQGLNQGASRVSGGMRAMGLAIAGGTALAAKGLSEVIELGNEYVGNINEVQAVTQSTGFEMARVSQVAQELGSDLSLPATSAGDAASAMKELAKGGLDVDEAMTAARGTLQLAAAAQVDAAQAAEIQSDALNQFGLEASEAGRVADILANTANAASGEIVDMANALKYVGPVAKSINVDINDVATAIGLVATQGIRGEQAGTSLRGVLASLAAPSGPAAKALRELGITAFDAEGRFVGLRSITEQLAAAQDRMTEAAFSSAAATAFGNEGMTIASALASTGAQAFDDMAAAVTRQGGAADVAAAKTRGLGGAWDGLKSQVESAAIGVYDAIDGPLERAVRATAQRMDEIGPAIADGLETAVAAGEVYGPRLAQAIRDRADVVGDAVTDVIGPIATGAIDPLNESLNTSIDLWGDFTGAMDNAVTGASSVAREIGEFVSESAEGQRSVGILSTAVDGLGETVEDLSAVLVPAGQLLGGLLGLFNDLPGPVQTGVLALAAFRLAQGRLSDSNVLGGLRQFSGEMRVQRELAAQNGDQIGRLGAAMAAYRTSTVPAVATTRDLTDQIGAVRAGAAAVGEPIGRVSAAMGVLAERVPLVGRMREAFTDAASGADRFGTAAGVAAASGTALRSAAGGLVSFLGGPMGIAVGGVVAGLSLLSGAHQDAEKKAAEQQSAVADLADALRESNGAITENIRVSSAKRLQDEGLLDLARELSIPTDRLTDAYLGNKDALAQVQGALSSYLSEVEGQGQLEGQVAGQNPMADKAFELKKKLDELLPTFGDAANKNKELDQALKSGATSMTDSTEAGRDLSRAMGILAKDTASADDKARALKDALDALSGGQVDLEAAQSRVNDQLARMRDAFGETADRTEGWGNALITTTGAIDTTTENGRRLFDSLRDISASTAEVAQRTFEVARANGDDMPTALAKAEAAVKSSRDEFLKIADAMGIDAVKAKELADRYGLVPSEVVTLISQPGMEKSQQELLLLKAKVADVPGTKEIRVQSLSEEAQRKLEEVGISVERIKDSKEVVIRANDGDFNAKLADALRPATKTVTLVYEGSRAGIGGGVVNHDGNLLAPSGVRAFADGGFHPLTPMRGGYATFVDPNTWRVIGDRLTHREAYIPLDGSARSIGILAEAAREMNLDVVRRFAQGGLATPTSPSPLTAAPAAPVSVVQNIYPQPGQSEESIGTTAARRIGDVMRTR